MDGAYEERGNIKERVLREFDSHRTYSIKDEQKETESNQTNELV